MNPCVELGNYTEYNVRFYEDGTHTVLNAAICDFVSLEDLQKPERRAIFTAISSDSGIELNISKGVPFYYDQTFNISYIQILNMRLGYGKLFSNETIIDLFESCKSGESISENTIDAIMAAYEITNHIYDELEFEGIYEAIKSYDVIGKDEVINRAKSVVSRYAIQAGPKSARN